MSEKVIEAQSNIDGKRVARMIIDFHSHFHGAYMPDVMTSSLCAVGPLQSMIGLAIANGLLVAPPILTKESDK